MIKFSVVEHFGLTNKLCNESRLIKGLTGEAMRKQIEPIRKLFKEGKKEEADELKKKLPAIIPSGIFRGGRTADKLVDYSQMVCLDLDDVALEKIASLKEVIANCNYTYAVFISPSGLGLKILVKVSSGSNYHTDAYKQVLKHYSKLTEQKFDEKTSDISRLMFMSYDPNVYHYPDSDVFPVITPISKAEKINVNSEKKGNTYFQHQYDAGLKFTEKRQEYKEGNRNNFIYQLASACNRYGLPMEELSKRLDWSTLPEARITSTIKSAYKNAEQFNTWSTDPRYEKNNVVHAEDQSENSSGIQVKSISDVSSNSLMTIPTEVYTLLPDFIKDITSHFSTGVEQDLVMLSSLGVLSSSFPNVKGIYDRSSKALNLFQIFVAPPSSGKGQMKWAEALGKEIDRYLSEEYKRAFNEFVEAGCKPGIEPPVEKKFYIGSDSSNIALATQMRDNRNIGVIYDSEGGTLGQMFKNDWSNYLNILLKSFEGESLSVNRKVKIESFVIEKCFLSLVLSTTPSQLIKIIGNIDSGLYSRFLIYYFKSEVVWKDLFSNENDCLEPVFDEAAKKLLAMYIANEKSSISTVSLSEMQRIEIYNYFSERLREFYSEYGDDLIANIRRTCVMYYKIAMILTAVRSYEENSAFPEKIVIDDRDHRAALLIVGTLLNHVKVVYETTVQEQNSSIIGRKKMLFESLPTEKFQKSEFLGVSNGLGIKKPTAEKWLNDLQKMGKVVRLEHGLYHKAA